MSRRKISISCLTNKKTPVNVISQYKIFVFPQCAEAIGARVLGKNKQRNIEAVNKKETRSLCACQIPNRVFARFRVCVETYSGQLLLGDATITQENGKVGFASGNRRQILSRICNIGIMTLSESNGAVVDIIFRLALSLYD